MTALRLLLLGVLASLALSRASLALDIQELRSPAGIRFWLMQTKEGEGAPVVALAAGFRGGAAVAPEGKAGIAEALCWMFNEGAGALDSAAYQQALATQGIDLSCHAGKDAIAIDMRFLAAPPARAAAARLLGLALTQLRFDSSPLARMREELILEARRRQRDPDLKGELVMNRLLFDGDAYARPVGGTETSLQGITAADLRAFQREAFTEDRLSLTLVGRISAAEAMQLVDGIFASLPAPGAAPDLPVVRLPEKGDLVLVEADIPQATILFAQKAIDRQDPDFFAALILDYVLGGGGFSSRLMQEVREKRGLSYGIGTGLVDLDRADLWWGSVQTPNASIAEVLDLIRAEWRRMAAAGPSAEELAKAKTYLLGSYARNFTSTAKAAASLRAIQTDGFGPDYVDYRRRRIEAVTLDDARRVAKRLLDAEKLIFVVVGKPAGIQPTRPAPAE